MEVFGNDMKIGNFILSEHGLMLASFNYDGESNDSLGLDHDTQEVYTGSSPIPLFIGATYSKKLEFEITLIKKCPTEYFTEFEVRDVLRSLTGMPYYQWAQILSESPDENLYYKCRTVNASIQRINGRIAGISLTMECDSPFAWSKEFTYDYDIDAGSTLIFNNTSDDYYQNFCPLVYITANNAIEKLSIVNITDGFKETIITNIDKDETITMDSNKELLTTSIENKLILNNFNFKWISFISGKNEIYFNEAIHLKLVCRFPRKVGIQI